MATGIGKMMSTTTTAGRGTRALLLPHVLPNKNRRRMSTYVANSAWTSPGGGRLRRARGNGYEDIAMVKWHDDASNAVVDNDVGEDKGNGGRNAMGVALPLDGHRHIEYWNGGTAGERTNASTNRMGGGCKEGRGRPRWERKSRFADDAK
jgi:hypothetical protein